MLALEGMMNAQRNGGVQRQPVGRPPGVPRCPSREFRGLLDLQLTEADRRPFKLPLQLGEPPIEPAEERLRLLRVALRRSRCHTNLAENRKCGLSQRRWS
jgi:hypothetical protein